MSEICFDYTGVKGSLDELKDAYKKMYNYSDDINQASRKLKGCIDENVITILSKASANNEEIAKNIKQLREVLEDILKEYKKTEKSICKVDIERDKINDPSKTDTVGEEVLDYILDALWQAFAGDATDTSNLLGILLSVGIGFIPYVGQLADLRDVIANIVKLCTDGATSDEWIGLGFAVIGFIPGLGDFLKHGDEVASVVPKLLKNADNVDEIADAVKGTMKKGADVYKEFAKKVEKAIDSDEVSKFYKNARDYITSRCEAITEKIADSTQFNENVDKAIKALGKYADKVIDKYITMGEQFFANEAANSAENGRATYYKYATGTY
ncbi:MAG: hypothetical protein K2L07_10995 [Lachnospiraceae bacterium]|nr:hypothetical protein [Lachnospiraceae bacterium]